MEIKNKVYEILSDILEVEVNDQTQVSMQTCDKWTSLVHIDIIMSIEEEFNIIFSQYDLPNLNSQSALIEKVESLV